MTTPSFPPLFSGLEVEGQIDPFEKACVEAARGCDAGLVVYNLGANKLRAALVFAPDVVLADAMAMMPLCGVGFQNALGALAPPEVSVHLDWAGGLRINGATCGQLRVAASRTDPTLEPDWLVVGLELPLWPENDDPGIMPDQTTLYAEGCADVNAAELLESWVKHTLVGINTWLDEGVGPLHKEWRGLAFGIGEDTKMDGKAGTFLGVDEQFGMLLRDAGTTNLIPLTHLLEGT
ncbi:biotin-(acetyl-CoA carboxylase) ligase [Litoreibacter meonggei]|uniref:Biotin-(Acetyl-CoA carboxylase) ligase n=1 Tax=Litoreibacter meonggei TaxID=1049199 RepID=A0A497WZF7_9RHOB|nr:biotin/lipoate--protein ligase family protein [Litoreibacter meonggei]RLJ59925.1 biotin-(acetyl-CoA carboxylase) ligase [Litoreibacter meonggei]